ncbi:MAG: PEGA domain-containing protein, partial [Deltaproteobacteria bacterium]
MEHLGKYRLLKRLAMGGMAEILLARQKGAQGFEKLVVVKRILPHLAENPEFVTMFLDEARLAAQLNHPGIVQIFDLGHDGGSQYFIAMEYVHGENLRAVQRRLSKKQRHLPVEMVARIIARAAEALHYAHTKKDRKGKPLNIVHRDVSPQNILVSYEGQVKVVDFGIAKAASQMRETRTGVLKGKYAYMSPEQIEGMPLDGRSDEFALAVVAWELLTGQRLYHRDSEVQTLRAIGNEPPPPPRTLRPEIPEDLEAIVLKALAKERDDRFPDCAAFQHQLEAWLAATGALVTPQRIGEMLAELFPERVEAWQEIAEEIEGEGSWGSKLFEDRSELFGDGTPSHTGASRPGAVPSPPERSEPSLSVLELPTAASPSAPAGAPAQRRFGPGAYAALAAGLFLGIGLLVVLLVRGLSAPPASPPAILEVRSRPPGARVYVDGRLLEERTPLAESIERGSHQSEVRVEAPG